MGCTEKPEEILFQPTVINADQIFIPKNLEEAHLELDRGLSNHAKELLRKGQSELTEDENNSYSFSLGHFGLGLWMRNNWELWKGGELSKYFNELGIHHPDDMTGIILRSYIAKLRGEEYSIEKDIEHYQAYWKKVEEKEKYEAEMDSIRSQRRKEAMLNWKWKSNTAPVANLNPHFNIPDVWGLQPYDNGFIVTVRDYREKYNPVWHDGIYFLAAPRVDLKPIKLTSCSEIYDVVVYEGVANWLCKEKKEGWSIISTSPVRKTKKRKLSNVPENDWLRLGKGKEGLLVISADTIYRESSGNLKEIYNALSSTRQYHMFDFDEYKRSTPDSFFPQRSRTPLEYDRAIYFHVEDKNKATDLYRLALDEKHLESVREIFVYDYIGNYSYYCSDVALGTNGGLWIASSGFTSLVKIAKDNNIEIASILGKVTHLDKSSIDKISSTGDEGPTLPIGSIHIVEDTIYLAGLEGIVKVENGEITPLVNYDKYQITPKRLGIFPDGSFVIGNSDAGLYILRKEKEQYKFSTPSLSKEIYLVD